MNAEGHLTANGGASDVIIVSAHMQETAGNDYMNESIDGIAITVYHAGRRGERQLQQHLG